MKPGEKDQRDLIERLREHSKRVEETDVGLSFDLSDAAAEIEDLRDDPMPDLIRELTRTHRKVADGVFALFFTFMSVMAGAIGVALFCAVLKKLTTGDAP